MRSVIFIFIPHLAEDQKNNTHTKDSLKKCLNGGYKIHNEYPCICPPGFKGIFCEEGIIFY